jgi:hypothetical protein
MNKEDFNDMEDDAKQTKTFIPYKDLSFVHSDNCFGCQYLNSYSMNDGINGVLLTKLMTIYTENRINLSTNALARQIFNYYESQIRPQTGAPVWTVEAIHTHFQEHCFYPTSEILEQLTSLRNFRVILQGQTFEKSADGAINVNQKNIQLLLSINKMILTLLEKKETISTMIGYNKNLKF